MDFNISVGETEATFEQFHEALKFIERQMSQWNGFHADRPLQIVISKVPSTTPTLGVQVDDILDLEDRFGG